MSDNCSPAEAAKAAIAARAGAQLQERMGEAWATMSMQEQADAAHIEILRCQQHIRNTLIQIAVRAAESELELHLESDLQTLNPAERCSVRMSDVILQVSKELHEGGAYYKSRCREALQARKEVNLLILVCSN